MPIQQGTLIKVYLPLDAPVTGKIEFSGLNEICPSLQACLSLLGRSQPVGVLGTYSSVFEIGFGFEGFRPEAGADPRLGSIGKQEVTSSICFTTYHLGGDEKGAVDAFVFELSNIHPWEHPVIEVMKGGVWVPG